MTRPSLDRNPTPVRRIEGVAAAPQCQGVPVAARCRTAAHALTPKLPMPPLLLLSSSSLPPRLAPPRP
jgi:hypothetical protein